MRIYCICGEGLGSSLILAKSVETVLAELSIDAEVRAVSRTDLEALPPAQLILATEETIQDLQIGNSELLTVRSIGDLAEIRQALSQSLS